MNSSDIYYKKNIQYDYRGHNLDFKVAQQLFSSQVIDHGTQRLLRTFIFEKIDTYNQVLDLGCGYGPIGIALKSFCPNSIVHMVDIDSLAIDYSRQNANLNNFNDIKTYASLGYDDVIDTDFDLIVSNIPAKIGEKALSHVLKDAQFYLKPKGRVAVVVIDAIAGYVTRELTMDPNINILFHKTWPGHVVFHYNFIVNKKPITKPKESAFDRGIFDREKKVFSINSLSFPMLTTYGLSEFNTFSYETELLINNLKNIQDKSLNMAIVFNPGQGHIPVALSMFFNTNKIILIDRNLQALKVSKRNLLLNSYPEKNILLLHQNDILQTNLNQIDCIVGILNDKDNPLIHINLLEQAILQLSPKGLILISSSSTVITRVETFIRSKKNMEIFERQRIKGKSIIILKHSD